MRPLSARFGAAQSGFTLIEMIVVTLLLAIAMLGILAVFDASARINKSESEVADAQGFVRFGIAKMSSAIRMAGSGGLYVTQAVLNHNDPQLAAIGGISVTNSAQPQSFDNVESGTVVTDLNAVNHPVRPGTDMIEVRGVLNSPMIGFDRTTGNGCGTCTGVSPLTAKALTGTVLTGQHVNEDPANRPQFEAIDAYTAGASATNTMFVLVSQNDDLHGGCSQPNAQNPSPQPQYPQPTYNVGIITQPTQLAATQTFGNVNFGDATAIEFNNEFPAVNGTGAAPLTDWLRHAGIMDDIVYFIDDTDPNHPTLSQGVRRGGAFDVAPLADDVEDMQIAYGSDTDNPRNDTIERKTVPSATDKDQNVSNQIGGDEWVPNVPGDTVPGSGASFFTANDFVDNPGGAPSSHCVRLHGVMIALVAKSKSPDPTYRAPSARGILLMNSPSSIDPPFPDTGQYTGSNQYRRRVQTLKINLRNYAFEG